MISNMSSINEMRRRERANDNQGITDQDITGGKPGGI